ncbi:uncharacterized protein PFL1_00873 [Pseudozyma flocculosa PF-1]|uniref:uncharacterized protein n=1 Tax=Pseudozyma flocculosa PF-1 TaxID=1277687 RepID=UPI00045616FB|nr:uncharacterized protein PFL1_00873 [Pseudozyma flocculosa PF-1]EPQ31540.1 hypothetical protein PFL1_00873 [Pseudozyma flocculosa PF-1]
MRLSTALLVSVLFVSSTTPVLGEVQDSKRSLMKPLARSLNLPSQSSRVRKLDFPGTGTFSIGMAFGKHTFRFDAENPAERHMWSLAERSGAAWKSTTAEAWTGTDVFAHDDPHLLGVWNELNWDGLQPNKYMVVVDPTDLTLLATRPLSTSQYSC